MTINKKIEICRKLLSFALLAILALSFLMFTFVFIINWEDWFFGTRLAGPLAGIWLFTKAAVAFILICLLVQYPRHRTGITVAAVAYFGIHFLDSSVTIRQNTAGQQPFSFVLALFLAIPVLLLILTLVAGKPEAGHEADPRDTVESPLSVPAEEAKRLPMHPLLLLLGVMVLLMICVIVVIPLCIAMLFTSVPFLHQMAIPQTQDTVLVRVDNSGNRVWTTIIPGYSLGIVELVDSEEGGGIIYGTYWMPQQADAQIRIVKLDRRGNRAWDVQKSRLSGTVNKEPVEIAFVDPAGKGAVVWLTNGGSLILDGDGKVIGQTPAANTLPQPGTAVSLPTRYYTSDLPSRSPSVRIWSGGESGLIFTIEDTLTHKEIQSIYSVNPTADGGYLVSASVRS